MIETDQDREHKALDYIEYSLETIEPVLKQLKLVQNNLRKTQHPGYIDLVNLFGQDHVDKLLTLTTEAVKVFTDMEDMYIEQRHQLFKRKI